MYKRFTAIAVFLLLGTAALCGKDTLLFNIANPKQVKVAPFDDGTTVIRRGGTLTMNCKKDGKGYQGVILTPVDKKYFDLSKGELFAFDVTNNSSIFTWLRLEVINLKPGTTNPNAFENSYYCNIALMPFEKATFNVRLGRTGKKDLDWMPQGMQHNFDGFAKSRFNIIRNEVAQLRIWSTPLKNHARSFVLSNFRMVGKAKPLSPALKSKEAFYPFIDEFGQYKHADWAGKTKSVEDLKKAKAEEDAFLAKYPSIPDRNKFGGWASGPTFKKGGWGKVKYKGKWFLTDPEGKLFWSLGMNTTHDRLDSVTAVSLRENYFEKLPENKGETAQFYATDRFPRYGFYKKNNIPTVLQFHFYCYNMFRKYGEDYHSEFISRSQKRFSSWGFNTNGNWVHPNILKQEFHHPYISAVTFKTFYDVIQGGKKIAWQKFPDIFNPAFADGIKEALQNWQKNTTTDPYCIGYFIDNELSWGKTDTFLAEGALCSPAKQHAKREMAKFYQKKYSEISKLNAVWGTSYKSWDDFLATTTMPADPKKAEADLAAFNAHIVTAYFTVCKEMINKYAPGKLYFGCRFNDWNVKVLQTAAKFVDGMSFNRYAADVSQFKLPDGADCPVIIGEWHFGTTCNGPSHGGLQVAATSKDRARGFDRYVRSALWNPQIIGVHYFKYIDQAATGRPADDENIQCGFVDITDRPYPEMVEASRRVSNDLYKYRLKVNPSGK